jgi:putative transposase
MSQRPLFVPFDREKAVRIYRRNLPHWRQEGATYFVTFHLYDSVPEDAVRRLEEKRQIWLEARGIGRETDPKEAYRTLGKSDRFLYQKFINRSREDVIDAGYGACYLKSEQIARQLADDILLDDGSAMHVGDFVIMPNHVHLLLVPVNRELELCMKRIKGRSATICNRLRGRKGSFWQTDSFDHIVRNLEQLNKYRQYIAENPKMAGIDLNSVAYYRAGWLTGDGWGTVG